MSSPDDTTTSPDSSYTVATTKDVHLPPFCPTDAATWFRRAEVQFRLKNISSDSRKADFVLASLPDDVFSSLADYLDSLGSAPASYPDLKAHLLRDFVPTPEERAERLMQLTKQPLGDQRSSAAFREMKSLIRLPPASDGSSKTLDLLRILWLLRLPDAVRSGITHFNDLSEVDLLKQADALQCATNAASRRPIFAVTDAPTSQPDDVDGDDVTDLLAAASMQSRHHSKRFPAHSQRLQYGDKYPNNHSQPPRGAAPKKADNYCFYHSRFGHAARKCRQPCSWPKNV